MKMKYAWSVATMVAALLMGSCAEDKGSYDYGPENAITIGGLESSYSTIIHEPITPAPTPKLEFGIGESEVTYSWRIDYKEVCNHPSLDVPIDASIGSHNASLVVTNSDGLEYFFDFTINVQTPYSQGLAVLSQLDDGTSLLGFQRRTDASTAGEFISDVFTLENPDWGTLGQQPVALTEQSDSTYYLVLNKKGDKILTRINVNTMKMERAFSLNDIPDCPQLWDPTMMKTCETTTLILANGRNFTYDHSGCGRLAASASDGSNLGWLDTGGGYTYEDMDLRTYSYTIGYAFPAYDKDQRQFVYVMQDVNNGNNFTYDIERPFNVFYDKDGTLLEDYVYDPVILSSDMTLVAGEKMYNKAGIDDGMGNVYPKENYSTAMNFIFKDGKGKAHFYTYDFDCGLCSIYDWWTGMVETFRPTSDNYGVTEDRVVEGLQLDDQTVVKALPDGRYWLIANGRNIHSEYFKDGSQSWDITLPASVKGNIVKMLPYDNETKLIVAVYDPTDTNKYKGGIAIIDIDRQGTNFGQLIEYQPNVCGKTVALLLKNNN
jgi:hypothetical protein